jgi:large subunit ribosomal protein L19
MVKVVEGERVRSQAYEGVVIARSNAAEQQLHRPQALLGEGVERVFPLYSPPCGDRGGAPRQGAARQAAITLRGRTGSRRASP